VTAYPYHRLDRTDPGYRWWRPLAVAPIAFVLYIVFSLIVFGLVELVAFGTLSDVDYDRYTFQSTSANAVITDPLALVVLLAGVAVMAPALWIARIIVRAGSFGRMSSVVGRLRWRWLFVALLPAVAYTGVQSLITLVVGPAITGEGLGDPTTPTTTYLLLLVVLILLVPFQASAEEYVFRGFVLQAVGGWVRWWPVAVLASSVPFVLGHLYNWWGLGEILVFALVTAWLTIRTGGLEAAIGVHVLNNLVAFGLPALGFENLTVADGSPESLVMAVVLMPLYALAVDRLFRHSGLSSVRTVERAPLAAPLP
jgi:membrane protease YdiL (CAAX protease family)